MVKWLKNSTQTSAPDQPDANALDTNQVDTSVEDIIEKMIQSNQIDPEVISSLLSDPATADRVLAKLQELGADEGGSPMMNIADYYRPRNIKYELKWPLASPVPLPMPFDRLNEETQFYVLFGEWTRREVDGGVALNNGDLATAEAIFSECLERAEQLAVPELKARTYEDFVRIAERTGDRVAQKKWITLAKNAREETDYVNS